MKSKIFITLISLFILSACGINKTVTKDKTVPTPASSLLELKLEERPLISLIPRSDGHQLTLKIDNIPNIINQIEYELIYTASDIDMEIEKGLGDTIKLTGDKSLSRDLLLGTSSCTNGCKYKYDTGVNSGILTLTFITPNNQVATYIGPFSLKSGSDIKKEKVLSLKEDNFSIQASASSLTEYFVLLKNYQNGYSVYGSNLGKGIVTSVSPDTFIKKDKTLISGDYIPQ